MRPALILALALLVAAPARGAEPVDLQPGQPAPYAGGLCDAETAKGILDKRRACEIERDSLREQLQKNDALGVAVATGFIGLLVGAIVGGLVVGLAKR